jgi:demethylmenaquinone methyltransferase/2-methoxy-6-polyprenyl-1,4-benzoquinol methylase
MGAAAVTVPSVPTPGAPETAAVRSMFDRIAPRYDLLNRLLSAGVDRRWRRATVDALALPPSSKVLDVCTGTADLLVEFLGRDEGHRGLGVDLSGEMLARGADKLRRHGLAARSGLVSGDAERLPVRDALFDGALIAFGIRNVGDPLRALREIHRVLNRADG